MQGFSPAVFFPRHFCVWFLSEANFKWVWTELITAMYLQADLNYYDLHLHLHQKDVATFIHLGRERVEKRIQHDIALALAATAKLQVNVFSLGNGQPKPKADWLRNRGSN